MLLLIGGISPNPGPPVRPPPPVGIVGWNCNGIKNSATELRSFLSTNNVKVACVQETKLTPSSKTPSFHDYQTIRRDRPAGGGGGLLTLIHHSISYVEIPSPITDAFTESTIVKVNFNNTELVIANVYVPPQSSCAANFAASIDALLVDDTIIVGDINAHNDLWSAGAGDPRGEAIADEVEDKNYVVINNPDVFTRPSSSSSPDVVFAPPAVALSLAWNVASTLNSDHFPMRLSSLSYSPFLHQFS